MTVARQTGDRLLEAESLHNFGYAQWQLNNPSFATKIEISVLLGFTCCKCYWQKLTIYALFLRHFFRLKEAKLNIGYARVSTNDHILVNLFVVTQNFRFLVYDNDYHYFKFIRCPPIYPKRLKSSS